MCLVVVLQVRKGLNGDVEALKQETGIQNWNEMTDKDVNRTKSIKS